MPAGFQHFNLILPVLLIIDILPYLADLIKAQAGYLGKVVQ